MNRKLYEAVPIRDYKGPEMDETHIINGDKYVLVPIEDEWVSVSDRLPEYNQEVLCVNKHTKDGHSRILTGRLFRLMQGERHGFIDVHVFNDRGNNLYYGGDYWAFPYICHTNFITHWMPLPQPPSQTNKPE